MDIDMDMISLSLKHGTQTLHRSLDQHIMLSRLMSNSLSLSEYQDTLYCLYAWHKSIETILYSQNVLNLGLRMQPKHPQILRDIQNISSVEDDTDLTLNIQELKHISLVEKLGLIYVIEGATLGGLILGPKIAKTLKRRDITNYYSIYGATTRENFVHNMKVLDEYISSSAQQKLCIKSAQSGFAMLESVFNKKLILSAA
jgi:heme oxygenase